VNERIVALSRRISATRSGRKPGHAGAAVGALASSSRKLPFQPSLSAGIRSARSSSGRDLFGQVEQRVDLRDRQPLRALGDLLDLVSRLHLALSSTRR
jgi:hypothetical protein